MKPDATTKSFFPRLVVKLVSKGAGQQQRKEDAAFVRTTSVAVVDDHSQSSTHSVIENTLSKLKKTVRFDDNQTGTQQQPHEVSLGITMENDWTEEQQEQRMKLLWYSKQENKEMKERFREAIATSLLEQNAHVMKTFNDAYMACCNTAGNRRNQTPRASLRKHAAAQADDDDDDDCCWFGLEQHVVTDAAAQRNQRKHDLLTIIYNVPHDNPSLSPDEMAELLREKCRPISRPARLFAMAIGEAQQQSQPQRDK